MKRDAPDVPNPEPTMRPTVIVDTTGPLPEGLLETLGITLVTIFVLSQNLAGPHGLLTSPQQFLDHTQLQLVPSYVTSSNGNVERRLPELRPIQTLVMSSKVESTCFTRPCCLL